MVFRNLPVFEREKAVRALVESFWPEAAAPKKWPVSDEDAFADALWNFLEDRRRVGSSGEVLAARFVAQVWRNEKLVELVGHFDLVDAFERWDERHRDIVRQWAREPWGA